MTMTGRISPGWRVRLVVALLVVGWQGAFAYGAASKQAPAAPPGWKLYTSKAMGFTVLMPGVPKQASLGKRPGVAESFALPTGKKGETLYLIIVGDYAAAGISSAAMAKTPPDKVLDKTRDGYLKGSKGKLLKDKKISVQGYSGRALEIAPPHPGTLTKVQMVFANMRMYQLSVSGPEKGYPAQDAQRFFGSLKLMKR